MTPSQIIALVRDAAILAALGFVVWWIWRSGEDRVKVADMAAVQKQLATNTKTLEDWRKEASDAEALRLVEMANVTAAIGTHNQPLIVRVPAAPGANAVPGHPAAAGCAASGAGGADAGVGGDTRAIDLRPEVNRFELKYESALINCRAGLKSWPH